MTVHGKDSAFKLEDGAGTTLRDIGPYLTKVDYGLKNDVHDSTTLGQEGHTWAQGLQDGTISLEGFWDSTASVGAATVLDSLVGLEITTGFEYGPAGAGAGSVKYSGECVLESVDYSSPVANLVTFSAALKVSGVPAKGVYP